jgi:hypothetical protein
VNSESLSQGANTSVFSIRCSLVTVLKTKHIFKEGVITSLYWWNINAKLPVHSICALYHVQWYIFVWQIWAQCFFHRSGVLFPLKQHWGLVGKLSRHIFQLRNQVAEGTLKNRKCNYSTTGLGHFILWNSVWKLLTIALPWILWFQAFHHIWKEFINWINSFSFFNQCSGTFPNSIIGISNLLTPTAIKFLILNLIICTKCIYLLFT